MLCSDPQLPLTGLRFGRAGFTHAEGQSSRRSTTTNAARWRLYFQGIIAVIVKGPVIRLLGLTETEVTAFSKRMPVGLLVSSLD
jgi:hypothetical protein